MGRVVGPQSVSIDSSRSVSRPSVHAIKLLSRLHSFGPYRMMHIQRHITLQPSFHLYYKCAESSEIRPSFQVKADRLCALLGTRYRLQIFGIRQMVVKSSEPNQGEFQV